MKEMMKIISIIFWIGQFVVFTKKVFEITLKLFIA
jgi:hypothetical protein